MKPLRTLMALALATGCTLAQASLNFSWSLDDWTPEVAVGQSVVLNARLFNNFGSTEVLRGDRLLEVVGEGLEDRFDFVGPLAALAEQLEDVALDPGENAAFVLGSLVPLAGAVPGTYMTGGFALAFADAAGNRVEWSPDRDLLVTVTVADTPPPAAVPEPATAMLLALGGFAALRVRRR